MPSCSVNGQADFTSEPLFFFLPPVLPPGQGTLFLWLYWPSFNAASVQGAEKHRAVMNTYLALAASCVTAFAASSCLDGKGKIDMVCAKNQLLVWKTTIVQNDQLRWPRVRSGNDEARHIIWLKKSPCAQEQRARRARCFAMRNVPAQTSFFSQIECSVTPFAAFAH